MAQKFQVGDIAYLVENNRNVSEGRIIRVCGDLFTFQFRSGKGGTKVKAHRLFATKESALASIQKDRPSREQYLRAIMT